EAAAAAAGRRVTHHSCIGRQSIGAALRNHLRRVRTRAPAVAASVSNPTQKRALVPPDVTAPAAAEEDCCGAGPPPREAPASTGATASAGAGCCDVVGRAAPRPFPATSPRADGYA